MSCFQQGDPDKWNGSQPQPSPGCGKDRAYVAIIISVIPLWAIITTLIVFALLLFHKHVRLTKIYDNCTKQSAGYVYHVEIRTGDTSATYNRRKSTITIDMFDENQNTLARIAIPGHVIFGRKDDPVAYLEDDKYFELRVTRLWLYRASRLKKVATIRLTHTCMEPEARIMIYGVELRLDEPDRHKLFFPVMSYITPYGTANKINACFDFDPIGSISAMGGRMDPPLVSEHLSVVDYILHVYLFIALVFYLSTFQILCKDFAESRGAILKGIIVGCASSVFTILVGSFMRYVVKYQYSIHVGTGLWAYIYHFVNTLIITVGTGFWIYATITAYNKLCSGRYQIWVISLCVAGGGAMALCMLWLFVNWIVSFWSPVNPDQFVIPEDSQRDAAAAQNAQYDQDQARESQLPSQQHTGGIRTITAADHTSTRRAHSSARQPPVVTTSPSALLMPTMTSNVTGVQTTWQTPPTGQPQGIQPLGPGPMMVPPAYQPPFPMYMQQQPPPPQQPAGGYYHQQQHPMAMGTPSPAVRQLPTMHHAPPLQAKDSYHTQVTTAIPTPSGRTRQTRKTGSNESTGSTYYQQLMKNKGGVKSISQYGELMKGKKKK